MKFKKYMSLTNHYQTKSLNWWLSYSPELKDDAYIIQEKIDGQNIQVLLQPNLSLKLGKRKSYVIDFNELDKTVENYSTEINILQKYSNEHNVSLRLYGEHFGGNIQRGRVNYGDEKDIRFFDLMINDLLVSQLEMLLLFKLLNITNLLVVNFGSTYSLQEALDFDQNIISSFNDKHNDGRDNIMEGVVVKPYSKVYQTDEGSIFYIKMKNDSFLEKNKSHVKVNIADHPLHSKFLEYITESRLFSVFSKEGEIEDKKDIGRYIKWIMDDAIEEFELSYPEIIDLGKIERKRIFNVGSTIKRMLDKYL